MRSENHTLHLFTRMRQQLASDMWAATDLKLSTANICCTQCYIYFCIILNQTNCLELRVHSWIKCVDWQDLHSDCICMHTRIKGLHLILVFIISGTSTDRPEANAEVLGTAVFMLWGGCSITAWASCFCDCTSAWASVALHLYVFRVYVDCDTANMMRVKTSQNFPYGSKTAL